MAKRVSVDRWLFTITLVLVFVGLVMVFSASAVMAKERYGSGYYFLFKQMGWAIAGLIAVFFLDRSHNTHRWIHLAGFSLQPSELAKPALILFLAYFLESRTKSMDDWRNTLLPAVIPTIVFVGLIVFQP